MATEKRLIDANELVRKINKFDVFYFTGETDIQNHDCQMVELGLVLAEIDEQPTVDAVEVVRCKDCKRYQIDTLFGMGYCNGLDKKPDDFCSYGERCNNE